MDQIPRRERKTSFSCSSHAPGQSLLCSGLFLSAAKIGHLPLTFLPSCGIRLCLRRTSRLAGRLPRREPLLAVLPPAVLTDGSPFRKCQLGSPIRFWRPFKSPRPQRRLAAAANFFVIAKDYSRRRNTENIFFMRLSVVVKSYLSLVAAFLQKSPARSSQRTPSYAKTVTLHIHRSM